MKALLAVLPALALSACAYHHEEHKLAPAVTRTPALNAGRREVLPGAHVGSRVRLFPTGQALVQGNLLQIDSTSAGGVLGIIAGGSIGALFGSAASDWQTVYRARPVR